MNNVCLVGNVARIDVKGTDEKKVVRFTLAVDRDYKDSERKTQTDFISCAAFKNNANFMSQYISKGNRVAVTGAIRTGSYQKDDGTKVYTTDVYVEHVNNLTPKSSGKTETEGTKTDGFTDLPDGDPFQFN